MLSRGPSPTIFPSAACATALIDRLVHHSEIISIEGESYRKREAEAAKGGDRHAPAQEAVMNANTALQGRARRGSRTKTRGAGYGS